MKNKQIILKIIFLNILNVMDSITTIIGLNMGFEEQNIIMTILLDCFGLNIVIIFKIIFLCLCSLIFYISDKKIIKFNNIIINIVILIYFSVVLSNLLYIFNSF